MMPGVFGLLHYQALCFLAALPRSKADFESVENNDCWHLRNGNDHSKGWIHDPHWFGTMPDALSQGGEGCPGGLFYFCEPEWSAKAHPEDLGHGWSIPMFLEKERYLPGDTTQELDCNDQSTTSRGGLAGMEYAKFVGTVKWKCSATGWEYTGRCKRARHCRARKGHIKLAPSRSLEETSLALLNVTMDVHELERYETKWFPCKQCHAHDVATGEDVNHCNGKVLLRCNEKDEVEEVDNTCTRAKSKKNSHSSLLEMDSYQEPSRSFLQGQPATKKANSEEVHRRASNWRGHPAKRRHEA